ncbi:MAG TPA: transporter [Gammaproteobacteria bacterium]|jgi:hypothetical protein
MRTSRGKAALLGCLLLIGTIAGGRHAAAQDLEPRSYSNAPVGMNFLIAGYGYAEGGLASDPSLALDNAELTVHGPVAAWARALDVLGKSAKFDAIVPWAWLSGSADYEGEHREREVSGFGDPRLRFSMNFFGAPALSMKEFGSYRQDLVFGASVQIFLPLGQYDPDRLVNIGTNRWAIRPEIGVSKAWGRWIFEGTASAKLHADNDDFFGGKLREQDAIYSLQAHIVYSFPHGIWLALDGTYYLGGQTTVNGVERDDLQKNSRLGATLALPVGRSHSIKLHASTGTSVRTGTDFDAIGVAWQYRWGGD